MQEILHLPFKYNIQWHGGKFKVWSESGYDSVESYTNLDLDDLFGERGWFTTIPQVNGASVVAVDSPRIMNSRHEHFVNTDPYLPLIADLCLLIHEVGEPQLNMFGFAHYISQDYANEQDRRRYFDQWYGNVTWQQKKEVFALVEKWSTRYQLV